LFGPLERKPVFCRSGDPDGELAIDRADVEVITGAIQDALANVTNAGFGDPVGIVGS
jgi:hypothetical protein